jgi:TonB family protein
MTCRCRIATALVMCFWLPPFAPVASAQSAVTSKIAATKVKDYVGQAVTVCAKVVTYDCDHASRSTTLDLEKPYGASPVGILISRDARERFLPKLEDHYVPADVCVTGTVERRDKRYVIAVDRPDQITVTKQPAPFTYRAEAVRPCDGDVELPKVVHDQKPSYTERALRGKQQGIVLIEAVVGLDGRVGEGRLLLGFESWTGLNEEAVSAIKRWRFTPGTIAGKPVPVIVLLELTFTLKY